MNNEFKNILEKYCLNKKNISTILKYSQIFMDITQQEKKVSEPKNKKRHRKIYNKDTLFWIFYIFEKGFQSYEMIGRDKYSVEMKYKANLVQLIKENKKNLKQYKIRISDLESDLLYSKSINIKTFFIMLVLKKINLIYYTDKLYYEYKSYDNDSTIIVYHDKKNNIYEHKEDINIDEIKSNRLVIESISKPIRAISYYKLNDIKNMCNTLKIDIMKNYTKTFTKKELYQKICHII
tara:strand:- start:9125 stop:9832 length:708 start_codon:yes stop_codon:yes gene_type:complete